MKAKNKGFTLIEILIVIAILSIAFEGLFHATVLIYREGGTGAEEMMTRQQIQLFSSALFRDVKNSTDVMDSYDNLKNSDECLILKPSPLSLSQKKCKALAYYKNGNKIIRRVYFSEKSRNETTILGNLKYLRFEKRGKLINWTIESDVQFQDHIREFKLTSTSSLNGGMIK